MSYPLLQKAPENHNSPEFIRFLMDNNPVIYEDINWLIIENCKYHTKDKPWITAFYKGPYSEEWYVNARPLWELFSEWEWLKKAVSKQTVRRFHLHLVKK